MNHRHLLPDEIDLLLDGEVGFGVSPLRAHVRECPDCRARLEEARVVVDALEDLPRFAPAHDFSQKVMANVPVFVPWHIAAGDAIRPWVPRSQPARLAVLGAATFVASLLTVGLVWITTQTDLLVFATSIAGDRLRVVVGQAVRTLLTTAFGEQAFAAVQHAGTTGLVMISLGFVGAAASTLLGLRALAAASNRQRI